ncbi:bifunctional 4-hydroxy-2-oxoglutarate aldolase/2-dehydro-3-deoxy-phosphogluconate aldolase [Mycobacterium sp. DL99]|uniref:bifunctional 4-hydroxy-2-oxoglutarate aldolase/2-dehydro-3-deoxy-phosphogluconate aldolase n=1 Tax=Mycobacterium sp. DL99 TaxID=2528957 RepID=UPI00107FE7CA|nr:bifunctional 4-hydroxy-2-oxoglutarate aldolase/2-dehydro-3-deoxy-phosphogluconate aldolase [Mycobacterium sp. DL99]
MSHTTDRLLAVLRAPSAESFPALATILVDEGLRRIEVTMSTAGALDAIRTIRAAATDDVVVGAGTVTTVSQVDEVASAGASFVVSPHTDHAIVAAAVAQGLEVYPGAFTPTEVCAAWAAGATAVKLFPAGRLGIGYLRDLRAPLPDIPLIPTGGIGLDDIGDWLDGGARAVGLGAVLQGDYHRTGDEAGLRARAARAVRNVGR